MSFNEVIKVNNLKTYFFTHMGVVKAVDDISFSVPHKSILGIVGESGSGKSVTALSIMRLVPHPGRICGGEIWFEEKNLLLLKEVEIQRIRGRKISIILQNPMTSLNPLYTIKQQLIGIIKRHKKIHGNLAEREAIKLINLVGISEKRLNNYPYEFSGGMRQRICIAMALVGRPSIIIADEPTTALDVTIQAQILQLIKEISEKFSTSIIFITHDLGVIAELCDYVLVMYAGKALEYTDVYTLFSKPIHPYTRALIKLMPKAKGSIKQLNPIKGTVPDLFNIPLGCVFYPRCDFYKEKCKILEPKLIEVENNHFVRCHLFTEIRNDRKEAICNTA